VPIYEFYCTDCHTVFSFFSRAVNTAKCPACPRCGRPKIERKVSRFAISKGRSEARAPEEGMPDVDEAKMERVMGELAQEAEGLNEDDPRQMARMMRKLSESGGLPLGDKMQEAIRRMEAGENPEKIEEEMGDALDEDDALFGSSGGRLRGLSRRLQPPAVDKNLYDL
jgi:putative FmdB family regulatory protein